MRSLFLKIFLWYWLVNLLVAGALMVVFMWTELGPFRNPSSEFSDRAIVAYGQEAVEILENDGPDALREYIDGLPTPGYAQILLFDEQGRELLERPLPPGMREQAARTARRRPPPPPTRDAELPRPRGRDAGPVPSPEPERRGPPQPPMIQVTGPSGRQYTVAPHRPRPPRVPIEPFVTLAVAAAVVSYLLARYVTAPVRRLRAVTLRLADGDLTARVGTTMGHRRDVIGDLGRDFDFMAERVEALVSVQQRLLRDVSHELRSPLARLNIALGLAARHAGPEAAPALERIELEAERLNEMIGRLLTLARLDGGGQNAERTEIDLAGMVRRVAADAGFEARDGGRRVRVTECEPCTVLGTPKLLHSAIENVIRNAICYTAEGTEVQVALRRRCEGQSSWAVIQIRDHGAGVPEAALEEIFRPFHRVTDARDRQTGGVGLGLAITERAIKLHGGTVSAANAPDGGLVVELHLPTNGLPQHGATAAAHEPSESS